jgi:DNA-binding MarR family transcriptional regulator
MIDSENQDAEAPQQSIGKLISCLYRNSQVYLGKELEQYHIGSGQFSFLMALYHEEGITQECLAYYLKVDKATSARAVKKLVRAGLVKRKKDLQDKRKLKVFLTKKGKRMEPEIKEISSEWTAILFSGFTKDEKKEIASLLEKMAENASAVR